jgi:CBS domain-containing protein/beta-phosphoglucomutase-like phosphatase (HAD superfamily)
MTLQALIIRADGVLADVDEVERDVLNHVLNEAGLKGNLKRADYERLAVLPTWRDRIGLVVRNQLPDTTETHDLKQLVEAMCRHFSTVLLEKLASGEVDPLPGVRETVAAARRERLTVVMTTLLEGGVGQRLVNALLGTTLASAVKVVCDCAQRPGARSSRPDLASLYQRALQVARVEPQDCLVLENTPEGTVAARDLGIHAIIAVGFPTQTAKIDGALFAIADLSELAGRESDVSGDSIWPSEGAEILSALRGAHAGHRDIFGKLQRSYAMKVSDILKDKGSAVKSISAEETILNLARRMKADGVGAMVVMRDDATLDGIITERDIANGLATHGEALLGMKVSQLMTRSVVTCAPEESIAHVARTMTQRRFRHMPVIKDGELIGLVSIGDVLKYRLDELQLETNVLRDFLIARG